eukprot:COSAG06_NODE_4599_length_4112_cov_14.822078_2_plen_165_part_00
MCAPSRLLLLALGQPVVLLLLRRQALPAAIGRVAAPRAAGAAKQSLELQHAIIVFVIAAQDWRWFLWRYSRRDLRRRKPVSRHRRARSPCFDARCTTKQAPSNDGLVLVWIVARCPRSLEEDFPQNVGIEHRPLGRHIGKLRRLEEVVENVRGALGHSACSSTG